VRGVLPEGLSNILAHFWIAKTRRCLGLPSMVEFSNQLAHIFVSSLGQLEAAGSVRVAPEDRPAEQVVPVLPPPQTLRTINEIINYARNAPL
jgi:hypothetical protein